MRVIHFILIFSFAVNAFASVDVKWQHTNGIESKVKGFYSTTKDDPWLQSGIISAQLSPKKKYLLVEMATSKPITVELRWMNSENLFDSNCTVSFKINQINKPVLKAIDLDKFGTFNTLTNLRLDPGNNAGLKFEIHKLKFVSVDEVPVNLLSEMIEFRGYTSKLHYLPGELIEYRVSLLSKNYPTHRSAKLLTVNVIDEKGKTVASHFQQYGLQEIYKVKEIYGVLNKDGKLKSGKYRLETISKDLQTGFKLKASHDFGVISDSDPYIYETPFKFVKDFTIIKDQKDTWHIFSITGDYIQGHDWMPDGNERTFSHGTSKDLRNWEYHKPVLSISDNDYPDGNGKYEDRNIWAPHVVFEDGIYYMYYTSINTHVSQSISLATSKDLFNWTKYDKNPVVTLEGSSWAYWKRDGWADARDPALFKDGDTYYMYFTVYAKNGDGTIAVCSSKDMKNWTTPTIAAVGKPAMESPQVWKQDGNYYMTTSSTGAGVWKSNRPDKGWFEIDFPRPPVQTMEKYVPTSVSYAEEVAPLNNDEKIIASITWRHWGNTIYISKILTDKNGEPTGYESPFELK